MSENTSASPPSRGTVETWPRNLLRIEGLCLFASSVWAYSQTGLSWWTFAGGILLPDLGMVGYIRNSTLGAALYNTVHTESLPVLLLCTGYARGRRDVLGAALIWLAHINMDRMFGFGLKYGTAFGHTHLGWIGKTETGAE